MLFLVMNVGWCVIVGDDEDIIVFLCLCCLLFDVVIEFGLVGLMTGWRARIAYVIFIVFV